MATPLRLLRGQASVLRSPSPWLARSLSSAASDVLAAAEAQAASSSKRPAEEDARVRSASSFPAEPASSVIDVAAYLAQVSKEVDGGRGHADESVELAELDAVVERAARKCMRRRRSRRTPAGEVDEELKRVATLWKETYREVAKAFTRTQLGQLIKLAGIKGASTGAKEMLVRKILLNYVELQDPTAASSLSHANPSPSRAASKAAVEAHRQTLPMRRSEAWLFATQVPFGTVRKQLRLGAADAQVLRAEMGFEMMLKAASDEQLQKLTKWLEEWKSTITRTTITLSSLFAPNVARPDAIPVRVLRDICSASDCFLTNVTLESEPDVDGASHEPSVRIDALTPSSHQRALSLLRAWAHDAASQRLLLAYEPSAAEQELALPLHEPTYAFIPHAAVQPVPPLSRREGLTWRMTRQYKAWELGNAAPPRQLRKVQDEQAMAEVWKKLDAAEEVELQDASYTREVHFGHFLYSSDSATSLLQPPLSGQWALAPALAELASEQVAPLFHPAHPPLVLSLARSAHVPALDPNMGLGARKSSQRLQLARLTYRDEQGKMLVVDVEQPVPEAFEEQKAKAAATSGSSTNASQDDEITARWATSSAPQNDAKADPLDELADVLEGMLRDDPFDEAASSGTTSDATAAKRQRPAHADLLQTYWRVAREADVLVPDSPIDMRLISCAAVPLPAETEMDVADALGEFVEQWAQLVKRFDKNAATKAQAQHTAPPVPLSHEVNPIVPSALVLSNGTTLQLQSAVSLSRHELVFSAATLRIDGVMADGDSAPRQEASLVLDADCAWDQTAMLIKDVLDGQYRTLRAR